jgi:hypothetical protein
MSVKLIVKYFDEHLLDDYEIKPFKFTKPTCETNIINWLVVNTGIK